MTTTVVEEEAHLFCARSHQKQPVEVLQSLPLQKIGRQTHHRIAQSRPGPGFDGQPVNERRACGGKRWVWGTTEAVVVKKERGTYV